MSTTLPVPTATSTAREVPKEKNARGRGRDGLKRRRKRQDNLKRSLEQQKSREAVKCRDDGEEEESQPAEGSRKALERPGRQDGRRTWKSTVSFMLYAEITEDLSIIHLKVNTALYVIGT